MNRSAFFVRQAKRLLSLAAVLFIGVWVHPPQSHATGGAPGMAVTPVVDVDFVAGISHTGVALDKVLATLRRGGTALDANGQPQAVADNTPRLVEDFEEGVPVGLLVEEGTTNYARSSRRFSGAKPGLVGSAGALPNGWQFDAATPAIAGVSETIDLGRGTEPDLLVRLTGNPVQNAVRRVLWAPPNGMPAVTGETITISSLMQRVGGSPANLKMALFVIEYDAGQKMRATSTHVISSSSDNESLSQDRLFPVEYSYVVKGADTRFLAFGLEYEVRAGAGLDVTIKMRSPQAERKAFRTSFVPTADAPATRSDETVALTLEQRRLQDDWFSVITARAPRASPDAILWQAGDAISGDRIALRLFNYVLYLTTVVDGAPTDVRLGYWLPLTSGTVVVAFAKSHIKVSYDGKDVVEVHAPNRIAQVTLGSGTVAGGKVQGYWNGSISRVALDLGTLSSGEMQDLATPAGLFDDFDRPDGPIGVPPTKQIYTQTPTIAGSRGTHVIANKVLITPDGGTQITSAYTSFDVGQLPAAMSAAVIFSAGSEMTCTAALIALPGGRGALQQIFQRSLHINFTPDRVDLGVFDQGVLTQPEGSLFYATTDRPAHDGSTVTFFGYRLVGSAVIVRMPDGTLRRRSNPEFAASAGRFAIFESYWTGEKTSHTQFAAWRVE